MTDQIEAQVLRYLIDFDGTLPVHFSQRVYGSEIDQTYFYHYKAEDNKFFANEYSLLYKLAKNYHNSYGAPINDNIIAAELQSRSDLNDFDKDAILDVLQEIAVFSPLENQFDFLLNELRTNYKRQHSIEIFQKGVELVRTNPDAAGTYVMDSLSHLQAVTDSNSDPETEAMYGWQFVEYEWEKFLQKGSFTGPGVQFGYQEWDEIIGGMHEGELVVLFGPSNVGKSWILHDIGYNACLNQGIRTVFVEREMQAPQIMQRWAVRQTRIPSRKLRDRSLMSAEEFQMAEAAIMDLRDILKQDNGERVVIIPFQKADTVPQIQRQIDQKMHGNAPGLIIADYLDEIGTPRKYGTSWEIIQDVTASLKQMGARNLCPVVTASQTNAAGYKTNTPGVSEVAYKSILKKCDIGIMLAEDPDNKYAPPGVGEFIGTPGIVNATVIKNRGEAKNIVFQLEVEFAMSSIQQAGPFGISKGAAKQYSMVNEKD